MPPLTAAFAATDYATMQPRSTGFQTATHDNTGSRHSAWRAHPEAPCASGTHCCLSTKPAIAWLPAPLGVSELSFRDPYEEAQKTRRKMWRRTTKPESRMKCWTNCLEERDPATVFETGGLVDELKKTGGADAEW